MIIRGFKTLSSDKDRSLDLKELERKQVCLQQAEAEQRVREEPGGGKVIHCRALLHRQDEGPLEGQK